MFRLFVFEVSAVLCDTDLLHGRAHCLLLWWAPPWLRIDQTKQDAQGLSRHIGLIHVGGARATLTTQTLFAHELDDPTGAHLFAHDARGQQCGAVNRATAAHWHSHFVSRELEGHCVRTLL